MDKCAYCKKDIDSYNEYNAVVNLGFDDEKHECDLCHVYNLDNGITTICESCGVLFEYHHLLVNPETNIKELCPYCHEVWCE